MPSRGNSMAAKLIAIEGLDGAGKETQTTLLKKALEAKGLKVARRSFPRYGEASSRFAEYYLRGEFGDYASDVNAYAASSFFAIDRLVSYLKDWHADYEEADVFLADRYTTSNCIHQCAKLPKNEWEAFSRWLFDYEFEKLRLPEPDAVFYLRIDVATSQRLLERRYWGDESKLDVHERDLAYLERSRKAAEWCCDALGWIPVECNEGNSLRNRADVHREILDRIDLSSRCSSFKQTEGLYCYGGANDEE